MREQAEADLKPATILVGSRAWLRRLVEGAEDLLAHCFGNAKRGFATASRRTFFEGIIFDQIGSAFGPSCTESFDLTALVFMEDQIAVTALCDFRGQWRRRFLGGHFYFLAKGTKEPAAIRWVAGREGLAFKYLRRRAALPNGTMRLSLRAEERATDAGVVGLLAAFSR